MKFKPGDLFQRTIKYGGFVLRPDQYQDSLEDLALLFQYAQSQFTIKPGEILVYLRGECFYVRSNLHCNVLFMHPDRGVCFMRGAVVEFLQPVEE